MGYDGSGGYARVHNWVTDKNAAVKITASRMDAEFDDFASAMELCLLKDGQQLPTANLPMNSKKHTGVAAASARAEYADVGSLQDGAWVWAGTASGASAITVSLSPTITAYTTGMALRFISASANASACTLSVDGVTAASVVNYLGSALQAGDIASAVPLYMIYSGAKWFLQTPIQNPSIVDLTVSSVSAVNVIATNVSAADITASSVSAVNVIATNVSAADITASSVSAVNVIATKVSATEIIAATCSISAAHIAATCSISGALSIGGAFITAQGTSKPVIQVVTTANGALATGTTVMPYDDTIPQNTEGIEVMDLAITPKNSSNILVIDVVVHAAHEVGAQLAIGLFQDATAGALAATSNRWTALGFVDQSTLRHVMTAGTTSATTFKVRIGSDQAGTLTFNGASGVRYMGGAMASTIVIREYSA